MDALTTSTAVFGLSAVAIVYWLTQHSRNVGLITDRRVAFLVPGGAWALLVTLYAISPQVAGMVMLALGGWVATLLFKAGAKSNESQK